MQKSLTKLTKARSRAFARCARESLLSWQKEPKPPAPDARRCDESASVPVLLEKRVRRPNSLRSNMGAFSPFSLRCAAIFTARSGPRASGQQQQQQQQQQSSAYEPTTRTHNLSLPQQETRSLPLIYHGIPEPRCPIQTRRAAHRMCAVFRPSHGWRVGKSRRSTNCDVSSVEESPFLWFRFFWAHQKK